jgi:hypothetical protein
MRSSHNNLQFIDAIIKAADRLDPALTNEFLTSSIETAQMHFDLIKPTLSELQQIRNERIINNASILLCLLGCLRSREV